MVSILPLEYLTHIYNNGIWVEFNKKKNENLSQLWSLQQAENEFWFDSV